MGEQAVVKGETFQTRSMQRAKEKYLLWTLDAINLLVCGNMPISTELLLYSSLPS